MVNTLNEYPKPRLHILNKHKVIADIAWDLHQLKQGIITIEEFADTVQERVYPDRVQAPVAPAPANAEYRREGSAAVFGIHWNTWLWDYSQALNAWLYHQVRHSPEVVPFRKKYLNTRELNSEADIWLYLKE